MGIFVLFQFLLCNKNKSWLNVLSVQKQFLISHSSNKDNRYLFILIWFRVFLRLRVKPWDAYNFMLLLLPLSEIFSASLLIFYPHLRTCFHWFKEEGRHGDRETLMWEKNHLLVASHPCSDRGPIPQPRYVLWLESNLQPSGEWNDAPMNWATPARAAPLLYVIFPPSRQSNSEVQYFPWLILNLPILSALDHPTLSIFLNII